MVLRLTPEMKAQMFDQRARTSRARVAKIDRTGPARMALLLVSALLLLLISPWVLAAS